MMESNDVISHPLEEFGDLRGVLFRRIIQVVAQVRAEESHAHAGAFLELEMSIADDNLAVLPGWAVG